MNSINMILAELRLGFDNPLYLLVLIPGVILAFWPYFRIRKDKRRTRERIVSMILHLIILLLASFVLAGFSIEKDTLKNDETVLLVDVSDSNWHNSEEIANYINQVIGEAEEGNKVGVVVFGAGEPKVYKKIQSKPQINVQEIYNYYDNTDADSLGFVMSEGTDIAKAINFAATQFSNYYNTEMEKPLQRCRMIIFSDGIETDGTASSAAGNVAALGCVIDAVYFAPKDFGDSKEAQIEAVSLSTNNPKPDQAVSVDVTIKSHYFGSGVSGSIKILDMSNDGKELVIDGEDKTSLEFDITRQEQVITTSIVFDDKSIGVHALKVELETNFEEYTSDRETSSYKQNNIFYSYVVVQDTSNKILIIYGDNTNVDALKALIEEDGEYTVDTKKQNQAPSDLSKYGEVILCNVNSSKSVAGTSKTKLPTNYDMIINSYVTNGGGLFTMGGEDTYYFGGMGTDKFNDILPIKVKPEATTSKGIVLLIDRSSGMCGEEGDNGYTGSYGQTRLETVKEAFQLALMEGSFSPKDYIGVIFFGGNKYTPITALQMTSASNVLGISNAINMDITSIANGKNYLSSTEWRHALEAATKMLQQFNIVDNKHVVLITDGAGTEADGESAKLTGYPDGSWKCYSATVGTIPGGVPEKCFTDYMYDKLGGITTSVINVGNNLSPAQEYMQAMVTAPATEQTTHYYKTNTAQEIKDAISIECKNIPTKLINDEQDTTIKLEGKEINKIATSEDLPDIAGYNGTTLKNDAVATIIGASTKDPIYAEWTYGKGKVGSLMTDLTGGWGEMLIDQSEPEGRAIVKYLVKNCFRGSISGMTSDMTVEFDQKNFTTSVIIKDINNPGLVPVTDTEEGADDDIGLIQAYFHSPSENFDATKGADGDADAYREHLCPSDAADNEWDQMNYATGTFSTKFNTMQAGLYTVAFNRFDCVGDGDYAYLDDVPPYSYITFSYSDEYDTFYDAEQSLLILKDIVNSAGGDFYEKTEDGGMADIFSTDAQKAVENIDPVLWLMLAALVLFILDICARKFHFLWPHEIIKKMMGKDESASK